VTGVTPDRNTINGHDAYSRAIRTVFGDRMDEPLFEQSVGARPPGNQATVTARGRAQNVRYRGMLLSPRRGEPGLVPTTVMSSSTALILPTPLHPSALVCLLDGSNGDCVI